METSGNDGVRVRWLVAGAFSASPAGRRFHVTPASFAKELEAAAIGQKVELPDRLGAAATRTWEASFATLKSFQSSELVAAHPVLKVLQSLAKELGQSDAAKRPEPRAVIDAVIDAVGDGKLAATLRDKFGLTPAAPAAPGDVDALLAQANAPSAGTPASAISSFVKAMRHAGAGAGASAARLARDLLEAEAFGVAAEILRTPAVVALEGAWRGLKLLSDNTPDRAGMIVEVIDVAPGGVIDAVREALPVVPEEEGPDAIFVFDPVNDPAGLLALANLGADADAPVVTCVTHTFFVTDDPHAVSAKIEQEVGAVPDAWDALRADEASRWLSVAVNRPVLRVEGTGAAKRVVFGSPVAALAAMLAASYHHTGAFARILGAPGSLKGLGTYELPSGRDEGMLVPTEAFYSIRAQGRLSQLGLIGLGSGRNADGVILAAMPTARAGTDLVPLSAQVLTGRVVRFARWVLAQLPPGSNEMDVRLMFEQAAQVFLFPSAQEAAKFGAEVVAREGQVRQVVLSVSARADLAGIPFHLAFALPLMD